MSFKNPVYADNRYQIQDSPTAMPNLGFEINSDPCRHLEPKDATSYNGRLSTHTKPRGIYLDPTIPSLLNVSNKQHVRDSHREGLT